MFKILQAREGRDFAYRDNQRIGWRTSEKLPDDHILCLDDVIQRALKNDLGLNQQEREALENLLNKTDDMLDKVS